MRYSLNDELNNMITKENLIQRHGLDNYQTCYCGSDNSYTHCCKNNQDEVTNQNEILRFLQLSFRAIWQNEDVENPECMYSGCQNKSIGSHSIQRGGPLKIIEPDDTKEIYRFVRDLVSGEQSTKIRREHKNIATLFWGFCNTHDTVLFKNVEGENKIVFTIDQLNSLVYRSVSYQLNKLDRMLQFHRKSYFMKIPRLFEKNIRRNDNLDNKLQAIIDMRAKPVRYSNMQTYQNSIEEKYDEINNTWSNTNHELVFSSPIKIDNSSSDFVFHHTSVIVEDSKSFYEGPYNFEEDIKKEKWNVLTVIVLPNKSNEYEIFVATSAKAEEALKKFVLEFSQRSKESIKNVLNNLIIENNEEFYFNKNYKDNVLTDETCAKIKEVINTVAEGNSAIYDMSDLEREAPVQFF